MKRRSKLISAGLIAIVFMSLPFITLAQEAPHRGQNGDMHKEKKSHFEEHIPDLTMEQKENIKAIRFATMKEMKPLRNELGEKEARYKTLSQADNADMDAINAQIDDISQLKVKITKLEAKAQQDIRAVLNDDQRAVYDMHRVKKMQRARQKARH